MKEYKTIFEDLDGPTEELLNQLAKDGWRLVATVSPPVPIYRVNLILERDKPVPFELRNLEEHS